MSKTLLTAAIAFVLSIGGYVLSAQDSVPKAITLDRNYLLVTLVVESKTDVNLKESLTTSSSANTGNATFGYVKNDGKFVSLVDAMADAEVVNNDNTAKSATLVLGKFQKNDTFQFGYGTDADGLEVVASTVKVASDAGFHAGYDIDSFYHLDFPKDPFDGRIEILVMGEPLPASTVTLLVALAAAAGLLLYNNRRTRERSSAQA